MALFMMVGCSQDFLDDQNQRCCFTRCSFTSRTGNFISGMREDLEGNILVLMLQVLTLCSLQEL
jgi:hypothetical protein